jgi:hypothetical protein
MQEASRAALENVGLGGWLILFTTEDVLPAISADLPQIGWDSPLFLPASTQRVLLMGRKL